MIFPVLKSKGKTSLCKKQGKNLTSQKARKILRFARGREKPHF
jgi:hypothetical protein